MRTLAATTSTLQRSLSVNTKFKVGDRVVVDSDAWFKPRGTRLATVTAVKQWSFDNRWFVYVKLDEDCGKGGRMFHDEGWALDPADVALVAKNTAKTFTKVGRLIKAERKRQDDKFGPRGNMGTMSREERLAVLTEEVGELAMAVNHVREYDFSTKARTLAMTNMKEELVQVAAVAVAWLEVLEESGVEG